MFRSHPLIASTELMSHTLNINNIPHPHHHRLGFTLPSFSPSSFLEHSFHFHLQRQWSHIIIILECAFQTNTTVIHQISGRTVYQLAETPVPAQCSLWVCFADCFTLLIDLLCVFLTESVVSVRNDFQDAALMILIQQHGDYINMISLHSLV